MIMMNAIRMAATRQSRSLVSKSTTSNSTFHYRYFSTKGLIINAVGADRLGIVSDMTKFVVDAGGNVGESQATKLGSYFSLMMRVDVPDENVDLLKTALDNMGDMNATVFTIDQNIDDVLEKPKVAYAGRLVLEGANHPGIVHKVTAVLARHGLNVDRMDTSEEVAPHGGTTLFHMSAIVQAYEPLAHGFRDDLEKCKDELENLGDSMNCDIHLGDTEEKFQTAFYGS